MRKIHLDVLKDGQPGVTPSIGAFLVEAAIFCLMDNGHKSGVTLKTKGDFDETFQLTWEGELSDQMKKGWNDPKEAAEFGATALAALIIKELLGFEILSRAMQGSGVDYQIGYFNSLKIEAHLEVSGIIKETKGNTLNIRIQKKTKQVQTNTGNLPVYIIVSEFAVPKTKIIKK